MMSVLLRGVPALLVSATLLSVPVAVSAQSNQNEVDEAAEACIEAARLIREEDDLEGAIEEANWCITGLKQLQEEIKLSLLPDELNGFVGGEVDNQSALGMSIIERTYEKGPANIKITLMTSSGDAGGLGALGALGELGKLFGGASGDAMLGGGGGKKVRIQKRTAIMGAPGQSGSVNISLKSGGTLQATSDELGSEDLVDFMRDFPVIEIDDAMAN